MHTPPGRPARVYPFLAFGILSFSFSAILIRFAVGAPGLAVALWRTVFAVLVLAPVALPGIGGTLRRLSGRDVGLILASGIILGLHFVIWIESLYHTSVASATVIISTTPAFLAVFGYLLFKEPLTYRMGGAIVVAMLGTALITWGDARGAGAMASDTMLGNGLALVAAVLLCFYLLIGRVVRQQIDWLAYVFPLYSIAAMTTVAVALLRQTPLLGYDPMIYILCILMALGPQILGHGSFNYAVKYFSPVLLGLLSLLEPIGASIFAYVLLGELPTRIALGGMSIVLLAVATVLWPRRT